jgi:hypothetical protein
MADKTFLDQMNDAQKGCSANAVVPVVQGGVTTGTVSTDDKVVPASITYDANVVAATITGFSWTVVPGATYLFDADLYTTMTTNGGLTVSFKLTTATLTSIRYFTYQSTASDNTTAASATGTTTTDATKMIDNKTAAYTSTRIRGSFVVGTGGTFALQACQNTSATGADVSIILIGSNVRFTRVL